MQINRYDYIKLQYCENESEAVRLALINLRRDLIRTLDCTINASACVPMKTITVGTIGISAEISEKADVSLLRDESGVYRKEAFLIQVKNEELLIAGTDRRGTIYGIYEFCEFLGVSPWYFFADVPVRKRACAELAEGYCKVDYPSVEYRGIFINDEEELEHWVWRYMGEETIGVKTYEKIFELLLRLRLNYIWPAMHVNSFNLKPENGALADRMGIVVGTSHCDMLMRSNNREWRPWLAGKGYTDVEYDYSLPGRNREILEEYWRESVEQNKNFEVSYTLGMRGIHDSGFETRTLAGKTGKELLQAKIDLLTSVIHAQEKMISETLKEEPVKTFVPYKEVLELYDNGLEVPEDLTLIWVNDNYGYIRRYPGEKERARKGGNGIYYHNSYWAPPGGSYLFLNSIPLSHTRNELKKAWENGIQKIWVTNFGAIKPLEEQLTYYARLAWEVGKENALTDDETEFLAQWLDRTFSGGFGRELAPLLVEFDQITNVRKVEQMDCDAFSQTAYGDEAAARLHRYEKILDCANAIYEKLPKQEKDAFFELVLMRIQAAYFTNSMYYFADRSNLCMRQGKNRAAALYTQKSLAFDHARRRLLAYYNEVMADGKWDGILTPEDFPPPRTAMHPACMPPLKIGERKLLVTVWNEEPELTFVRECSKWIEAANAGEGSIAYTVTGPDWLQIDAPSGIVKEEARIILRPDAKKVKEAGIGLSCLKGIVTVTDTDTGNTQSIPVSCLLPGAWEQQDGQEMCAFEDDGRVTVEAEAAADIPEGGWHSIPHLGRDRGALLEARREGAVLEYQVTFISEGSFLLELHRFPTLNSVGRIRVGVSVDGGPVQVMESQSTDEHRGTWNYNIRNNVDKLTMELPCLSAGTHRICFHAIDRYFAFSRFVIYTKPRKENNLGVAGGDQQLPRELDAKQFADSFYGQLELMPRPMLYLPFAPKGDTLTAEDIQVLQQRPGRRVTPEQILGEADQIFAEKDGAIRIDAAAALKETSYACTKGSWQYCNSPSYDETGLAMYLRQMRPALAEAKDSPSLHYRISAAGGTYRIWVLLQMWGTDTCHFTIGLDETVIPEKKLYNGKPIWRYSMEQVWKWVPVYEAELAKGEHELAIYSLSAHLRFDRIYLTSGEELPPVDETW